LLQQRLGLDRLQIDIALAFDPGAHRHEVLTPST
jgi:hypothetical protein